MAYEVIQSLLGVRVLVVEDHDDSRDILEQVLSHAGAHVVAVSNARAALSLVSDVDIVVTDFAMPGEDGCWLLRQVEGGPHRVPVIVVTGFSDDPDVKSASFARVLRKPTDPWRLCADIREVLGPPHR
jgi:CheY-like chemotaxis protein